MRGIIEEAERQMGILRFNKHIGRSTTIYVARLLKVKKASGSTSQLQQIHISVNLEFREAFFVALKKLGYRTYAEFF